MAGSFTKTLVFSRQLLRVYQTIDRDSFLDVLSNHARSLQRENRDNLATLNSRLMTLLSGMLSVLLGGDPDEVIRKQVSLSESFLNIHDPEKKVSQFIETVIAFLDRYDEQQKQKAFSDLITYRLSSCSMNELRQATVSSVAEHFGYHPNYLSSKFKKEKGTRLQDVINHERLNRAFYLLKDEERISVSDLAREVGFTDVRHFRNLFKKRFGFTPSQIPRE